MMRINENAIKDNSDNDKKYYHEECDKFILTIFAVIFISWACFLRLLCFFVLLLAVIENKQCHEKQLHA